jgi:bifunctional non-homologous end joining protein LigD
MLAATDPLPTEDEGWAWEPTWDGWRVLVRAEGGQIKLQTRKGRNIVSLLPELAPLADALGHRRALLDGELVAFGPDGRPDFGRLSAQLIGSSPRLAARAAVSVPLTWVAFDVCYLDGSSL